MGLSTTFRAIPARSPNPFVSWTAPAKRSGDGAFVRTHAPRAFADRRPHESGVALPATLRCWTRARTAAVSQTSRSGFAGMTASEILNPACGPDALRLIRRRAGHSRGPLQGRAGVRARIAGSFGFFLPAKKPPISRESVALE